MEIQEEKSIIQATEEQQRALVIPSRARVMTVTDQRSMDAANFFLEDIIRLEKFFDDTFDPGISQADKLHKSLIAKKRQFTDPLKEGKAIIKPKIGDYLEEEDRKHLEACREKARAEMEAKRIADAATDKALELDRKGQVAKGDAVIDKAYGKVEEILSTVPVIPGIPVKRGFSRRKSWKVRIVNAALVPREYLIPDESKLNRMANAMQGQIAIAGCEILEVNIDSKRL